ncbi:MAG: hybrid sensor histidine kinase/response regulator [Pseudomonadota bacterium]
MDTKDAEFLKKLLVMFKTEAREHLDLISSGLTALNKGESEHRVELVETVFREAHSLKGAARSVNLPPIVNLCQSLENVFSALKQERIILTSETCELLQQTVDYGYRLIDDQELTPGDKANIKNLLHQLDTLPAEDTEEEGRSGPVFAATFVQPSIAVEPEKLQAPLAAREPPQETPTIPPLLAPPGLSASTTPVPVATDTVRITTEKLDTLLLQAEEMIAVKLAAGQRAAEMRELKKVFKLWRKETQREGAKLGKKERPIGETVVSDPLISSLENKLTALVRAVEYDHRVSSAMIDKLLEDTKKTLMLPFSSLLEMFPRLVRELARAADKRVELTTVGGELEIDRRVLEEMKDPLIHLIRNCVDHGIEPAAERKKKHKPPDGKMRIAVSSKDNKIEIAISDDGGGIDVASIKSSAVKHGVISREVADKIDEQTGLQLIFSSGVTTSPLITDISGRGLGLAIVREKVEKLNGTVSVESRIDSGTTFRLVVPLTLATFRGTLVRIGEHCFILPSTNVERVARAKREAIRTVENRETLMLDGRPISLVGLADVLKMPTATGRQPPADAQVQVVVLGLAEKRIAFIVDEVLHEQEVLVKPLGRQLSRVRNISGATVLGNGRVTPVLCVADLLKSAAKNGVSSVAGTAAEPEKRYSVLVVEDSITARTLLKNILESAGYHVQTAVDGLDGITTLKSREFDIVVSDVEMPRMNGFDLTAKIRADKKLAELPVILVTALESREDRERGIDVGANAYIVKSSFDQSNLLEVIERLT